MTVKIKEIVKKMALDNLTPDIDLTERTVGLPDINRPARVLVDVYGVGVLIMGESGIGKSEAAHRRVRSGEFQTKADGLQCGSETV